MVKLPLLTAAGQSPYTFQSRQSPTGSVDVFLGFAPDACGHDEVTVGPAEGGDTTSLEAAQQLLLRRRLAHRKERKAIRPVPFGQIDAKDVAKLVGNLEVRGNAIALTLKP